MQFTLKTTKREEIINITQPVQSIVSRHSIKEGLCNIFIPHATAAITTMENVEHFRGAEKEDSFSSINENCDEKVCEDFLEALRKIAPRNAWKHDSVDGNGDAHVKAAIIKPNITIPIQNNRLLLGRWQGIMFCEFDGPRDRTIIVNCLNTK
jgi:thiamine phosphate synthase YjbQ (UPF0047 family)